MLRLDGTSEYLLLTAMSSSEPTLPRIGSLGAENSPTDVSRVCLCRFDRRPSDSGFQGMYAGEVGIPRLLKLFAKYDIKTTWFIPGTCLSNPLFVPESELSSTSVLVQGTA